MCMRVPSSFQDHFASLSDPRSFRAPNLRHDLIDILVIAVCAVICGAEGWEDIEDYGYAQAEWFSDVLSIYPMASPLTIPSGGSCPNWTLMN
ncbi:hypothetical protein C2W62_35165 [Candidatus Entotheonella serta]|nr:hypothetical protein C2W62_35165 [Candidatus Entotheonella serta]